MIEDKIKIVFLTKAPIGQERINTLEAIVQHPEIDVRAVVVEEAIHLPIVDFIKRTLKRSWKGGIRLHDLVRWSSKYFWQIAFGYRKKNGTQKDPLKYLLNKHDVPLKIVKNTESESSLDFIKSLEPDLGVIYVHRLLKEKLFSIPKLYTINLHPGILPKYAGGEPCFWLLVDKCKEAGLTVHKVTEKADSGKLVVIRKFPVGDDRSRKTIIEKVTLLVPQAILTAILKIKNQANPFITYDNGERLYRNPPSLFTKLRYRGIY